jgi:HlyD family secretion protein
MNRKQIVLIVLGVVIVGAVAAGVIWRSRQQAASLPENLRSAVVEQGGMVVSVTASGNVKPARRVDLAFETGGEVIEVGVQVGERVEAGALLARLDTGQLELQVEQAEANLALAEAQLAQLQAGAQSEEVETSKANLRASEAQVAAAAAERDQVARGAGAADVAAAEADVASAITQQKKAYDWHETTMECRTIKRDAGDVVPIGEGRVITLTEDFEKTICPLLGVPEEQARYRLEAADEALEAARKQLDELEAGADREQLRAAQSNVAAAAAQRDAVRAQLDLLVEGATEEQIAAAQASVDQTRASLKQAEVALDQAVLKAPFDGIVAVVDLTVGQQAAAGLPVVTLIDPSLFHVTIGVDELDVGRLEPGQTARLTFDALPESVVTGTIGHVAEASGMDEGVVTYDVRIDLAPTDAPIRSDMTTSATVIVEEIQDTLKIPTWAIHVDRDTGAYYVRRRVGDRLERVNVKLGVRSEGVAQVLDGLSAGDEVVRVPESSQFDFAEEFGE